MVKVLLDSSFILTCVKQKIDFFDYLQAGGYEILIPREVINEIEKKSEEGKGEQKNNASITVNLLKKPNFKKINLAGKNVDRGIISYAKENKGIVVATLDQEIKKSLRGKNKILVVRGKRELEVLG
jgi:rRNA-processing protein FCF1